MIGFCSIAHVVHVARKSQRFDERFAMKYLILGCDPVGDCPLWEENALHAAALPVALEPALKAELLSWNEDMAAAVLAASEAASALSRLNSAGEKLAHRISASVKEDTKIRYLREDFPRLD